MSIPRQSVSDYSNYFQIQSEYPMKQQSSQQKKHYREESRYEEYMRLEKINSIHSELRQVFKSSQVRASQDQEQAYHEHRMNTQIMHDEMRRKSIDINTRKELSTMIEQERRRRMSIMEELLGSTTGVAMEMERTNRRLSSVHDDLKESFKRKEFIEIEKENKKKRECEEKKESLLQQIRHQSAIKRIQSEIDTTRYENIRSYNTRLQNHHFFKANKNLMNVQMQLLKLVQDVEGNKQVIEREEIFNSKERKEQMQEQLIRKANQDKARKMSLQEQRNLAKTEVMRDPELEEQMQQLRKELQLKTVNK